MQASVLRALSLSSSLPLLQPLWTLTLQAYLVRLSITVHLSKGIAVIVTIVGTIAAILYPMDDITDFLYLIGSVFAPMIAILLADYFINRQQVQTLSAYLVRGLIWAVSVGLYHYMLHSESTIGATLPAFTMAFVVTAIVGFISKTAHISTEIK